MPAKQQECILPFQVFKRRLDNILKCFFVFNSLVCKCQIDTITTGAIVIANIGRCTSVSGAAGTGFYDRIALIISNFKLSRSPINPAC